MAGFKSYYTEKIPKTENLTLNKEESHHLITVLRAKKGNLITLFDGWGTSWITTLINPDPKAAIIKIEKKIAITPPSCKIILAQAMPKGKGMEQIIQKAVEIGVSKIIPLKTARTELKLEGERQEKRIKRWNTTAIEACKQSGNLIVPEITYVQDLKEFLKTEKNDNSLHLIASLEKNAQSLKNLLNEIPNSITWLIGPEGDFTPEEYEMANKYGFAPISLTKNVLRIETAVVYALSITDFLGLK